MKVKKFSKSAFAVLLTVLLMFSAFPICASAVGDTSGFEYELLEDGTAEITGYNGSDSTLDIPSEIDGYKVTSIGGFAFYGCTSLTSVTIPDSVTSIGEYAFNNCTSLTSVTIPDSVTSIGSYAFSGCTSLASVTIPDSVTSIGIEAFSGCISLENINVDNNNADYTSENGVLFNKEKTELIGYPAGKPLTGYSIPDSVTSIGRDAFRGCTSLTSVTIPESVTSIGEGAFNGCTSLENINVDNNNADYTSENGVLFNKEKTELIGYPAGKPLTGYSIPDSVTSIGNFAFYGCTSLTSVTIPDSVTSIGYYGFSRCTSLKSITIPKSVTQIGWCAFNGCTSLESITIPDSITGMGLGTFENCTNLAKVTIPDSVERIDERAFNSCTSLKSITIPKSVTQIAWHAFNGCTSLTSITIPDSVTYIAWISFESCTSLKSVTIPNSVTYIGDYAFGYIYNSVEDTHSKIENFTICGYTGSEAENYAVDNGFTFIALDNESNIHSDSNTGISVIAKADADLTVSEITDEQSISEANLMLAQGESVKNLYDISLTKDGEKVQHEGMAEVKIPCDNENAKVYRVENDNTLTDMNAVYTDGNLVFHTEHFSLYIVASQSEKMFGDINADGKVDVTDVTALQNLLAESSDTLNNPELDLNSDSKVNVVDVTYLQQYLAGTFVKL